MEKKLKNSRKKIENFRQMADKKVHQNKLGFHTFSKLIVSISLITEFLFYSRTILFVYSSILSHIILNSFCKYICNLFLMNLHKAVAPRK